MISGADRRPEKIFYSQMLSSFIFRFFLLSESTISIKISSV